MKVHGRYVPKSIKAHKESLELISQGKVLVWEVPLYSTIEDWLTANSPSEGSILYCYVEDENI